MFLFRFVCTSFFFFILIFFFTATATPEIYTLSLHDALPISAAILDGHHLPPTTVGTVSPGSRQILTTITSSGVLERLERAGVRILEPACGPCVGIGQAPPTGKASVRTFNRNFKGRSGTADDQG